MGPRKPLKKLDSTALLEFALKSLGARAQSTSELKQKLLRRAASETDIDGVLAKVKEYGFLDDQRFAEAFANSRVENRGQGQMRVLRDLKGRRVASNLAGEVVQQTFAGKDETEMIEAYLKRKYRSVSLPEYLSEEKHLASAYRRLRYAGFSSGKTRDVLMRYAREGELLDRLEEEDEPERGPE